jgi:hypothetical protein
MANALQHERKKQRQAALTTGSAKWECEQAKWRDEREFLIDVLRPHHSAITKVLVPLEVDLADGDLKEEYAIDLIYDAEAAEGHDPCAGVINDVYRDGAEAALAHIERAVLWRMAFKPTADPNRGPSRPEIGRTWPGAKKNTA